MYSKASTFIILKPLTYYQRNNYKRVHSKVDLFTGIILILIIKIPIPQINKRGILN